MPEDRKAHRLEIPVIIAHEVGRDPAETPEHKLKMMAAVRGMDICASLFWVVRQLGLMAADDGWVYTKGDLYDALAHIGELGQAVAAGAGDQAQYLEQAAERLHKAKSK